MVFRVAINGFGRIGRLVLRAILEQKHTDIRVIAINDSGALETNAHLLRYDSVHGPFPFPVKIEDHHFLLPDLQPIKKFSDRNPLNLPWKELDIDIVF